MKNCAIYEKLLSRPLLIEEIDQELARRSLREFVRQAWHVVEPATEYVPGWHLDAITEHLEAVSRGQIKNLLINIPPRHMKSLAVAVFWPCWEWIDHPERRWLFASYAATLSIRDSLKCRRLIESDWYQRNWGDRFRLTSDQNTKGRFENDRSGYRLATSVSGTATGEGGDRIVIDDPHNVNESESDTIRHSVLDWWDTVMSTRLNDPKTGARVIVMQRVHEDDLSGHLLAQGGYEHLCLPAEYEAGRSMITSIGWSDPRTVDEELLWPERFGVTEIETLKRSMGSYAAAGQLQQRPAPAEGGLFKRHWWRYWKLSGTSLPPVPVRLPSGEIANVQAIDLPAQFDAVGQSWDMAFKDLVSSDYVVGQVWGKKRADCFLLDQTKERLDFPGTLRAVRSLSERWPAAALKLVEDKANGSAVIATLKHELSGLVPVNPEGGKEARASAVSPQVESGNVYLPHPALKHWVTGFIEECASFPNAKHDDQVDGMTQILLRWSTTRSCPKALWI
jgi:predicted phage terminase large subunit-like protein